MISSQVRSRLQEALRHYDEFGECIFCAAIDEELQDKSRLVITSDHFVALEPFASPTPFCTHIYRGGTWLISRTSAHRRLAI